MLKSFKQVKSFNKTFSKKYTTDSTSKCIFPMAYTPKQKAICISAGIIASGLTMAGVVYGFKYWFDAQCNKPYVPPSYKLHDENTLNYQIGKALGNTAEAIDKMVCNGVKFVGKHTNKEVPAVAMSALCSIFTIGVPSIFTCATIGVLTKIYIDDYRALKNTTGCCAIIRRSASLLPKTTLFGAGIGIFSGITYLGITELPKIHNYYLNIQEA